MKPETEVTTECDLHINNMDKLDKSIARKFTFQLEPKDIRNAELTKRIAYCALRRVASFDARAC